MFEVLEHYREKIAASRILADLGLQPKSYFLVSLHREENVDYPDNLQALVQILADLHAEYGIPIVVSTHPRTRKRLVELGYDLEMIAGCRFLKPFGFLDYNALQIAAKCVLSDSGTISEESAILKFPAVTVRNSMERPEALDAGTIVISGLSSGSVQAAVRTQVASDTIPPPPAEYLVANTSERVVKLIIGTAGLAARWDNLLRRSR
jgi:UDP-N-acetylglucosamine 2-epimerase (non-hydrolysing)